jgi:hypothetical protein
MSVPLFVNHWDDITRDYPAFKTEYPDGPAKDGKLLLNGTNFILASQVRRYFTLSCTNQRMFQTNEARNLNDSGCESDLTHVRDLANVQMLAAQFLIFSLLLESVTYI